MSPETEPPELSEPPRCWGCSGPVEREGVACSEECEGEMERERQLAALWAVDEAIAESEGWR